MSARRSSSRRMLLKSFCTRMLLNSGVAAPAKVSQSFDEGQEKELLIPSKVYFHERVESPLMFTEGNIIYPFAIIFSH